MGATFATLQDVLKNFYVAPIRNQLNDATVLLSQTKKSSTEVVGEMVVLPLRIGRNWGVGARGTTGTGVLPTAGNQQYSKATFTTKDVYGRVSISGKTIRATKNDRGAFLRSSKSETEGMTKDLANDINRMMYGNGDGILTTITTGATSATQTVGSTQYLEPGQRLDIDTDTNVQISTINSDTSITLTSSIATTTGDTVRITGVSATDEINGLDLITDNTGTLETVDPTVVSIWKGNVFGSDAAPAVLNEDDMQDAVDAPEDKGGKINLIVGNRKARNAFRALLSAQKRFTSPNPTVLKGGFKAIDFDDIPLTVDKHAQRNDVSSRFYFLDTTNLGIYRMADFDWMQEDGKILARQVGSGATEAYEGTLVCDMEYATNNRNQNSRLEGIKYAA